jgi:hypothetical protein
MIASQVTSKHAAPLQMQPDNASSPEATRIKSSELDI